MTFRGPRFSSLNDRKYIKNVYTVMLGGPHNTHTPLQVRPGHWSGPAASDVRDSLRTVSGSRSGEIALRCLTSPPVRQPARMSRRGPTADNGSCGSTGSDREGGTGRPPRSRLAADSAAKQR